MRNTSRILALTALTLALSSSLLAATWSGWKLVEGGGVTDAAVAGTAYNGSIHLYAKAADRKLYHNRGAGNGTGWGSWSEVPGGGYTDAAPAAATQGGKLYLFAKGIKDRAVYVNRYDGKAWAGWSQVPGNGQTDVALAAVTHNNNIYLFGKGYADKKVYVNRFDARRGRAGAKCRAAAIPTPRWPPLRPAAGFIYSRAESKTKACTRT